MAEAVVHRIHLFPLTIPLRRKLVCAAGECVVADIVVVSIEFINGTIGVGETVPRRYLTGETTDSVIAAARGVLATALLSFHPESFPDALEMIEALPWRNEAGAHIPSARAAVELALLDAAMRTFHRGIDDVVQWMGLAGFGSPGSLRHIRFSGVLAAGDEAETMRQLRLFYWRGLRHFKLKVGMPGDDSRLRHVAAYLRRPLGTGKASLRVDANGAWRKDDAIAWLSETEGIPLAAVEQPLAKGDESELAILRDLFDFPLILDESVVTCDDARQLIDSRVADGFDIEISKCGGLLPALRLAALSRRANMRIQLGCAIGETSILSAAGLRFLEVCPGVQWAEGCLSRLRLQRDVVARGLTWRYGGRPPSHGGEGLGVDVPLRELEALCADHPIVLNL